MKPKKLYRHWAKSLQHLQAALDREWPRCRKHGGVESIHRLRVLLRRARIYVRQGRAVLGRYDVRVFCDRAKTVSNAVGLVRDCDMALQWLRKAGAKPAEIDAIRKKRLRLWRAGRNKFKEPLAIPQPHNVKDASEKIARKVYSRLLETAKKAWQEVHACPTPIINLKNLQWHELRRDLRRLRYLRELVLTPKQQRQDRLLRLLIHLQNLLGTAQNCQVTSTLLKSRPYKLKLADERRKCLEKADSALDKLRKSREWRRIKSRIC